MAQKNVLNVPNRNYRILNLNYIAVRVRSGKGGYYKRLWDPPDPARANFICFRQSREPPFG
ncbi:hypothetical protein GGTG_10044 [Gaeumannomyces tritici R3-111a-1]|uniref:Uncharacterized protein n=1 Tax=Gaeumannomyces tritici (strain R3-111a-1) TaxID=644352 RepID=J3P960_GAET3|nr:hypothetical protein GGTG_10044 [Gaeumannomyces tritici R3-111a-1]EJT73195.1 hypothetical protein GGTG_10044 [Gaeumannomyces tritici R3-111a-1]